MGIEARLNCAPVRFGRTGGTDVPWLVIVGETHYTFEQPIDADWNVGRRGSERRLATESVFDSAPATISRGGRSGCGDH